MNLPFTSAQFFSVFVTYNQSIWPAQIVAYLMGFAVVIAVVKETAWSGRFIAGVLALFWIWTGAVYHLIHFSAINPAAWIFGVLFIMQGVILAVFGTVLNRFRFGRRGHGKEIIGALFIVYAMLLYPLLGHALGHRYPAAPVFGVAPCPTTIFTFGIYLFALTRIPWYLYLLPLLWSLVGMSAAINLHVSQDYGLVVAGIAGTIIILRQNQRTKYPLIP